VSATACALHMDILARRDEVLVAFLYAIAKRSMQAEHTDAVFGMMNVLHSGEGISCSST